jgi:hypothetical protein
MPLDPADAYQALLDNPARFLRTYPIRIFGTAHASGERHFELFNRGTSTRPGRVLGRLPRVFDKLTSHSTERFEIRPQGSAPPGTTNSHVFAAHCIRMDTGASAMNPYNLPAGNAQVMLTGELSGCSFVVRAPTGGAGPSVAHIRPQGQSGAQLQSALLQSPANAQIYGGANYNSANRVASIIGVRRNNQWEIYAQKLDGNRYGDYRIMSIYQIWPRRRQL